jgi:hypothetical protein
VDDVESGLLEAAAGGARHYTAQPTIFHLHGVTGAMAVSLLTDHIDPEDAVAALGQLRAEHASLYGGGERPAPDAGPGEADAEAPRWEAELARLAADSRDAHQVKLVEACRRGWEATGDGAFLAAARRVSF